jgi:sec-independent protein translocase protein TatA
MLNLTVLLNFIPGGWEWVIILFAILLLFGGRKIPELARGLGKGIREFKDASKEIKDEIKKGENEVEGENKSK